ncbi:MAG TPA: M28 family peptidase [Xanthomonadales bacterium]|nr:M28 family peptidase [Xanthomonadales bacterium]
MSRCTRLMRSCAVVIAALLGPAAYAADPVPTIIVDIHALGAARLAELKAQPSVRWSAEFGTELLLGVDPASELDWLAQPRMRRGLGTLAREEIWIRDHVCVHQSAQPALGVVGGFEILRMPPAAIRYSQRAGLVGTPLPADGVMAREVANSDTRKAASGADPQVQAIVNQIDADRWFQTMSLLAGFNRNSYSAALGSARDWILSAFEGAQLSSSVFPYTLSNVSGCTGSPAINIDNPIGTKVGSSLPDEWIVVGAHYDSRNSARCDGVTNAQPGANDNASGCAGVIELARAFVNVPTQRSILFMCFSGEEQGLVGSRRYVESLTTSGDIARVKHMINLDMIGFDAGGSLDAQIVSSRPELLAQYAAAAATYAPELNLISGSNTAANTDYWYFQAAGVPSIFTWENGVGGYVHYHQSTDIPANMTRARELAGGILKMDAAVLASVAGLEPPLFADGFE